MKIVAAFDKYKGALDALVACSTVANVLHSVRSEADVLQMPITDGGEGFVSILTQGVGGRLESVESQDPLGRTISAPIGWVDAENVPVSLQDRLGVRGRQKLAVIEMASASGLQHLSDGERDPWKTSSYGTGILLKKAAQLGADAIILGVGGSATNDLGCGCLQALGVSFQEGRFVLPTGICPQDFFRVDSISRGQDSLLPPVYVACDVRNPLLGEQGATAVFGPQKGLGTIESMENEVRFMADLLSHSLGNGLSAGVEGAGAAGGIAYGLSHACPVTLVPGFSFVAEWMSMASVLEGADWLLTGEGKIDESSLQGKGPLQVAQMAKGLGASLAFFPGTITPIAENQLQQHPWNAVLLSLSSPEWSLQTALNRTKQRLEEVTEQWAEEYL